jgi:hypothetical protein
LVVKVTLRTELASLLLIATMFVLAGVSWSTAPDRIPMHWDDAGQVDRVGGRAEGLLLLPIAAVIVYIVLLAAPRSRGDDEETLLGVYVLFRTGIIGLLFTAYVAVLLSIRGWAVNMSSVAATSIGVLVIAIGIYSFIAWRRDRSK